MDPACGSGNFLYIALERLLALEKEVIMHGAESGLSIGIPGVSPSQLLGMEIDPLARELAQVAIWIGYLQWMIRNGFGWSEPVLQPLETIRLQDALITETTDGVSETPWPAAEFIIGNPPFLGDKKMRADLGDTYVETLRNVYRDSVPGGADLCCYFFEQARGQIERTETRRAGLLATNSIRGGINRRVLQGIKRTGDIYMAWSDEPWVLNGASVRISIVGFDNGGESVKTLNGMVVDKIHSDLTAHTDITHALKLAENRNVGFIGPTKKGPFDISADLANKFLNAPVNVNGRPNSDVIRPYYNGMDVTRRPRDQWVIDFADRGMEESSLYELPFEYVKEHILPLRVNHREDRQRLYWWLHARTAPDLRKAIANRSRMLVSPTVSKYRLFVWLTVDVYPDHKLCAFSRDDDYFLGVLHSKVHEVWSLRLGSSHGVGNDPVYTPSTCFETFPLPWPPGTEPVDDPRVIAIGEAAANLDRLRRNWLDPEGASEAELKKRTLTNLYNQRPTWLQNAHAALDRAVWAAYGWDDPDPAAVDEDTILARLLALNLERAGTA